MCDCFFISQYCRSCLMLKLVSTISLITNSNNFKLSQNFYAQCVRVTRDEGLKVREARANYQSRAVQNTFCSFPVQFANFSHLILIILVITHLYPFLNIKPDKGIPSGGILLPLSSTGSKPSKRSLPAITLDILLIL